MKSVLALFLILLFRIFFKEAAVIAQSNTTTTPTTTVNVGVVLDLDDGFGKMGLSCINMALSDFYAKNGHYKTRLAINARDSKSDVVGAAAAALDLIKNVEVQAIMGPTTSTQADFVVDLGEKSQVPILSFSASNPFLTSIQRPYFFRATQNDSTQVKAISAIVQAFGWRQAVPIYIDNEFGEGILPYLTDALREVDARVPYRSAISPLATDDQIALELYKLMTKQTRVFILHMFPSLGARVLAKAAEAGMISKGYVWIMTSGMTEFLGSFDPEVIDGAQGILGVKPYVPKSKQLDDFKVRWRRQFQRDYPEAVDVELNVYGLWAYDAAVALATAIERAGTNSLSFQKASDNSAGNSTDLETFGKSSNGPDLIRALSNTSLKGLSGTLSFENGQLPSSAFQIVNVDGDRPRGIGFWTPSKGLVKNLSSTTASNRSALYSSLAKITWPGDSTSSPKGWELPTNEPKLRIAVPKKEGFEDFVKVTTDPSTNATTVTGYCIDVFEATVKALPYALPFEYIPFVKADGTSAGNYDDLTKEVQLGKFDALVGDTTILANRTTVVDFTLPYTESGVYMVVPMKDSKSKNAWVFLKPLSWDLWVSTLFFFVFVAFVVWVLEHRVNEDFGKGSPLHQAGTSFWFSFSTMVFAQRESVVSNLTRIVVIIWCFVVLVLTQNYTASLASLLTVQQLQPTYTDWKELARQGLSVAHQKDCFVSGILLERGFHESNLKMYTSAEELHQLFSNGSIAAAFDEIAYMRMFLKQDCSKYTMIGPVFRANGLGFVFPKGSPLVPDVSRALLNVMEGNMMEEIENHWLTKNKSCAENTTSVNSDVLSLSSFWGLFLIAGAVAFLALVTFTIMFVSEHWQVLTSSESGASIWARILELLRIFYEMDPNAHTLSKSEDDKNVDNTPNVTAMPSPSVLSIQTDFPGEQGTPYSELSNRRAFEEMVPNSSELRDSI